FDSLVCSSLMSKGFFFFMVSKIARPDANSETLIREALRAAL
nr:hypothetical protein [Klebsiella pneumoniae]